MRSCSRLIDALALLVYAAVSFRARARLRDVGGARASREERPRVPAVALVTPLLPLAALLRAADGRRAGLPGRRGLRRARHAAGVGGAAARRRGDSRLRGRGAGGAALHGHRHAARRDASSRSLPRRCGRSSRVRGCATPIAFVLALRRGEPARALSRPAQSLRRGHRDLHRAAHGARAAAGRARRRDHGGRAGAERLRSHQYRQRVGRELHRRADRRRSRSARCPYQIALPSRRPLAVVVVAAPALFGERAFAPRVPRSRAPTSCFAGFYAPAVGPRSHRHRRRRHGVGSARPPMRPPRRWPAASGRRLRLHDDPNASDCANKRYAAYVRVERVDVRTDRGQRSRRRSAAGRLRRLDRDRVARPRDRRAPADADEARRSRVDGVARLRGWATAQPTRSKNLFADGRGHAARRQADVLLRILSDASTATCASTCAPAARRTMRACARATSWRTSTASRGGCSERIVRSSSPTTASRTHSMCCATAKRCRSDSQRRSRHESDRYDLATAARGRMPRFGPRTRPRPSMRRCNGLGDPSALDDRRRRCGHGHLVAPLRRPGRYGHRDRAQRADARGGAAARARDVARRNRRTHGSGRRERRRSSSRARRFTGLRRPKRWASFAASRAGAPRCCSTSATRAIQFTRAYGDVVRAYATDDTEALRARGTRGVRGLSRRSRHARRRLSRQPLDRDALVGRAASSSYLPASGPDAQRAADANCARSSTATGATVPSSSSRSPTYWSPTGDDRAPPGTLRVGIDVGGTFTDVVAIDAATRELVARVKVPTTHTTSGRRRRHRRRYRAAAGESGGRRARHRVHRTLHDAGDERAARRRSREGRRTGTARRTGVAVAATDALRCRFRPAEHRSRPISTSYAPTTRPRCGRASSA